MTKAQQLRAIVEVMQQEYLQTRPQKLVNELIESMTSLAHQRFSSMVFVFSDEPPVIKEAISILKQEGFKISYPGATPSTVKFEW